MSSCKRIIARLDVKGKKLIKGIRFEGLRVIGDACIAAENYAKKGIDEIFYTDAVASLYGRNGLDEILRETTKSFVPYWGCYKICWRWEEIISCGCW